MDLDLSIKNMSGATEREHCKVFPKSSSVTKGLRSLKALNITKGDQEAL